MHTKNKDHYYGKRKTQILHTRLQTGCSSLNLDLFLKNITDSPLCNCGSIENVQHYFFHCIFFQHQRTLLFNDIRLYRTPTLNLLLCNSYTMGCLPVRGDNPRALASGLSCVQVDKHGITILYHLHQCRPCTSRDISC